MPCMPRSISVIAAALLFAASTVNAATIEVGKTPSASAVAPGKLTNLKIGGGNGNLVFKTTQVLSATAEGITAGACGLIINSTATQMQPVGFIVSATAAPFPQTRTFTNMMPGNHTVTASPIAGPNGIPPCSGTPITVNFTVVK